MERLPQPQMIFHRLQETARISGEFFPQEARSRIEGAVRFNRKKFGRPETVEARVFEALAIAHLIPTPVLQAVWRQLLPNTDGYALIYGLPEDREIAEVVHLALSTHFGLPFNYAEQNSGELPMALAPKQNSPENTNTTAGEFGFHTDDALVDSELRTKFISLYGIINPPRAWTYYSPIDPVWNSLHSKHLDKLLSPNFLVRMPVSFGRGDNVWSEPRPVFYLSGKGERCVAMATYAVRPADPDDSDAVDALQHAIAGFNTHNVAVSLDPGTFLIFDNDRGMHKRTAINGDRLILRTYIRQSLDTLRRISNNHGYIFSLKDIGL
jgi:hypothetical protein